MQRQTQQHRAIRAALDGAGRPLSPQEILDGARQRVRTLNLATVYRTLKRLVAEGAVQPVELPGEPPRYELRSAAERHHHHFRCRRCNSVFDLQGCVEGLKRLVPRGFRLRGHDIVLYGSCAACSSPS